MSETASWFEKVGLADLEALLAMPEEERSKLAYDWRRWARPKQLQPPGAWSGWLVLAGRGAGKTRSGAEWVRSMVETGRMGRIALIAETAADCRDVLVEGESGILAVSPPWNRPVYESSKRRLTWPNGAIATLYNGTEPDQLRGPQHDGGWLDELCLVPGTLITCARGDVPVERVAPGDFVLTRRGYRRVERAWQTSRAAQVYRVLCSDGTAITGTAGHPVWVEGRGFIPLRELHNNDTLIKCTRSRKIVYSGEGAGGGLSRAITKTGGGSRFIGRCTEVIMAQSLRALIFTTSTIAKLTMPSRTWLPLLVRSTLSYTAARAAGAGPLGLPEKMPAVCGPLDVSRGAPCVYDAAPGFSRGARTAESSSARAHANKPVAARMNRLGPRASVSGAKRFLPGFWRTVAQGLLIAPVVALSAMHISASRAAKKNPCTSAAWFVAWNLWQSIRPQRRVPASAAMFTGPHVVCVTRLSQPQPVYNIEVEGEHEYFANGILTHNCKYRYAQETMDMFLFGLRLGSDPRYLVTTTPRPIKLIKEMIKDPYIVVTRGSSLENIANLSPTYKRNVIDKYAGTRLGRQEIDAEILTDTPGALWTLDLLDLHRVSSAPALTRIVVAIDPAAKSGVENAESGIVVAGVAADGRAYVLQDLSLSGSPDQVMKAAVAAYHEHKADRVVAEVNNGGDWIESVIRKVDADVSYKGIHASRGKIVRAEPVSALYEQGRVSHVGAMPALEDQMIEYTGERGERSPDRMDACVWALTELMLGAKEAYTVKESDFVVQPFRMPEHWPRAMGMSSTVSGICAVWLALDKPNNTVYLYTEHMRESGEPSSHIRAILARGAVRAIYVHDTSKEEALAMAGLYQGAGIKFAALAKCAEADLTQITELLSSGRLKVFSTMQKWIADYRRYREQGKFEDAPLLAITGPLVRLRDNVAQVVAAAAVVKPWKPADKAAGY